MLCEGVYGRKGHSGRAIQRTWLSCLHLARTRVRSAFRAGRTGRACRTGRLPARSLRAEQVAQTRSALIGAGRRLFGEQGFAATSVDDLARAARVTTGALYHHFPTKTALFETVFEAVHAGAHDGLGQRGQRCRR